MVIELSIQPVHLLYNKYLIVLDPRGTQTMNNHFQYLVPTGTEFTLACEADGDPNATVYWTQMEPVGGFILG